MLRSGNAAVARLLTAAGLEMSEGSEGIGGDTRSDEESWEGAWFSGINDRILEAHGGSWDDPPLVAPRGEQIPQIPLLQEEMSTFLRSRFGSGASWGWQDARTSLTIPVWRDIIPDLRFVVCVRNPLDVAASLARDGLSPPQAVALWHAYMEACLRYTTPETRLIVHYDDMQRDPERVLDLLAAFVGLPENGGTRRSQVVLREISARTRGEGHSEEDVMSSAAVPTYSRLLYDALRRHPESADRAYRINAEIDPAVYLHPMTDASATLHWSSLQALQERTQQLQAELEALKSERDGLHEQISIIEDRFSYQLLERAWRTQQGLFPPGSRRGKIWWKSTQLARSLARRPRTVENVAYQSQPSDGGTAESTSRLGSLLGRDRSGNPLFTWEYYDEWARRCDVFRNDARRARHAIEGLGNSPTISIVMPVYNTPRDLLCRAIESVQGQFYKQWELCICNDASTLPHVWEILDAATETDPRIKVVHAETNSGIVAASKAALSLATGEYVGLLDHDDELTLDALMEVAAVLQNSDVDMVYSDEDKVDGAGRRHSPFFKPAWSPDLLTSVMYTSHFSVYRKALLDEVGGFREGFDGSQDYDLALRITERASRIVHIPKVLYHWGEARGSTAAAVGAKAYAIEAARTALGEALQRRGYTGVITLDHAAGFYRAQRSIAKTGKVSIIIPTRDRLDLLQRCIESIERKPAYDNYEIIVVDNGSKSPETLTYLADTPHRVIHDYGRFNYSRLNNAAAREADGKYLLFLNNDTEILSPEWLSAMIEHAQRPEVGAVGAKLLYPDGRIQHAGVVLGPLGMAAHAHRFASPVPGSGYFNFPNIVRNYSAVTAACMMVRRDLFLEIGGFDEQNLPVAFNDIDLCLRLRESGHIVVYTPYAVVRHYESASRGVELDSAELAYFMSTWQSVIEHDPYYHPTLSMTSEDFSPDFSRPDSLRTDVIHRAIEEVMDPLAGGVIVEQGFAASEDRLCDVAIQFATYRTTPAGLINFQLRDAHAPNAVIASVEVDASTIDDNAFHDFFFDPIPDSAGKAYRFSIEFIPSGSRSRVSIWKSSATDVTAGPHFRNGKIGRGTLSFKTYVTAEIGTLGR